MRFSTLLQLAFSGSILAAPVAQFDIGALLGGMGGAGGFDIGSLLGGMGGAGGFDIGSLLGGLGGAGGAGGLDLGAIVGGLGLSGADPNTDVIIAGYTSVKEAVSAYDTALNAVTAAGDATQVLNDALAKAKAIETAMKDATGKIEKITTVDLLAAANLSGPGNQLTTLMEKTIDSLISKKDTIAKANQTAAVLQVAKDLKSAVDAFTKAINAKLPDIAASIAQTETQKALATMDKAIAAFSA